MRVLVCGGRNYADSETINKVLDDFHNRVTIELVIHGAAAGADRLASQWAVANNVCQEAHFADWDTYGKAAGPLRNKKMILAKPDIVLGFPGGRGTDNMLSLAVKANIPTLFFPDNENFSVLN